MASVEITKWLIRPARIYDGYLDGMNGDVIYGWALNASQPDQEVKVSFYHQGALIGELVAREFREDLRRAKLGWGHGGYGFYFTVPPEVRALRSYTVSAYADGKTELPGSPLQVNETPGLPFRTRGNHVRDFLAEQYLCGKGIEIGALNAPCKVPQGTTVMHVDSKSTEDLIQYYGREMHGLNVVPVDLVADAHTLAGIESGSQDFATANQVLEHLENPLRAFENMLRVVKPGGVVFLSLPDKRYTFDAARPVTPFEHILEDYKVGPERGREAHYREWMEMVENVPAGESAARLFFLMNVQQYPIHFHVWTQFEMCEMFDRARTVLPFAYEIDCFKANDAEALFVLRKL
jgi:SAM-dependent methyltransferase